ncbi:hypothetical protein BH10PLA1_BH10PLA1_01560 [soil metagenome]
MIFKDCPSRLGPSLGLIPNRDCMRRSHLGFTLVELLVVIAIVAVLVALLMPVFSKAKKMAQTVKCLGQQRQLGLGFQMYSNNWRSVVPIGLCRVWPWDGGTGDAFYWFDFLQGSKLYGKAAPDMKNAFVDNAAVFYCPTNKRSDSDNPGWYGSPICNPQNPAMSTVTWGIDPTNRSTFEFLKLSAIKNPSDFPMILDSTMAISKFPGRGARQWSPSAFAVSANASSRGMVWLAHENRCNVLFADGHAECCDVGRLMNTSIVHSVTAGVTKYGIHNWATENFSLESQ